MSVVSIYHINILHFKTYTRYRKINIIAINRSSDFFLPIPSGLPWDPYCAVHFLHSCYERSYGQPEYHSSFLSLFIGNKRLRNALTINGKRKMHAIEASIVSDQLM